MTRLSALVGLLLAGAAQAGETDTNPLTVHPDVLFRAQPGSFTEKAIGRMTVAYDDDHGEYVMFFETWYPESYYDPAQYQGCAQGVWGLNRATSVDGLEWEVDSNPLLMPQPDSWFGCVIAHPNVIYDGEEWHLWFKAEQPANVCAEGDAPEWGCDQYTGIGYGTSRDGVNWTFRDNPILALDDFDESDLLALGYPSVVVVEDGWVMLVAKQYLDYRVSMLLARSDDRGRSWQVDPEPVFEPGGADWIRDRVYNPALLCEDDPNKPSMTLFFAGVDHATSRVGFGKATSDGPYDWYVAQDAPYFTWDTVAGENPWIHWTGMRAGDDYVVYFTERTVGDDGVERPQMRAAFTNPDWDEALVSRNVCPPPTGPIAPVDDDDDEDPDVEPPDVDESGGCTGGCRASGGSSAWLLLLPLLGLRRRR